MTRTGSTANPFAAFGQWGYYRDTASRLYVRARHLRVDLGRWVSRDPIGFAGESLYAVSRNTPTTRADPTGLWDIGSGCDALPCGCEYVRQMSNVLGDLFGPRGLPDLTPTDWDDTLKCAQAKIRANAAAEVRRCAEQVNPRVTPGTLRQCLVGYFESRQRVLCRTNAQDPYLCNGGVTKEPSCAQARCGGDPFNPVGRADVYVCVDQMFDCVPGTGVAAWDPGCEHCGYGMCPTHTGKKAGRMCTVLHEMLHGCGYCDWGIVKGSGVMISYLCKEVWPSALACCLVEKLRAPY